MNEDYLDDRVIIPEEILKMTREERQAAIRSLETEARKEKERILMERKKKQAERA